MELRAAVRRGVSIHHRDDINCWPSVCAASSRIRAQPNRLSFEADPDAGGFSPAADRYRGAHHGKKLSEMWNQRVVIDNRAGASGLWHSR